MEQSDVHKKVQYNAREPGRERFQPASHPILLEPASSRNTNMRLPDLNAPEVKPVLNYSIQTGEEFALEFMRDRVNHKKPLIPNSLGNPNHGTSFMELKGVLGTSHIESENGSDISMLHSVENGPRKGERTNLSLYEEKSNYELVHSVPQTSAEYESRELLPGYSSSIASGSSSTKIKVLCSFGGTILPRPSDGKLRYVGGDTRIIRISRDISWQELKQKTFAICNQPHVIKYQLPGEDLDALVSVSCDEDLRNMMEEWIEVDDREGSQKLRMFLFSMSDLEDAQFGLGSMEGDSEVQYVVAINGMDMRSRRNSILHGLGSSSGNNLNELDGLNIDRETSRAATASVGINTSPLTSTFQSAQPILQNSSTSHESHPHFYHGQMMDNRETQQFLADCRNDSSNYSAPKEIPQSTSLHSLTNQQGGMNAGQSHSNFQVQNSQMLEKEVRPIPDGSVQHGIDIGKSHPIERVSAVPVDEISVAVAAQEGALHSMPSKNEGKQRGSESISFSVDAIDPVHVPNSCEDDQFSTSSSIFGFDCADSVSNLIDLSYVEPSAPPQRVYYSERIPREQAELMNRLSKSDDSLGSQFLIPHSRPDIAEQKSTTASAEKLIQSNLLPQTEDPSTTAEPLLIDPQPINGLAQPQKYIELAAPDDVNDNDSVNRNAVLKADHDCAAGNHKKPVEETGEARFGNPAAPQTTPGMYHRDPVSDHPGHKLGEITGKVFASNENVGYSLPYSLTESSTNDVSQEVPPIFVSATKPGDISIDINDRFPRDFLSEIFSRGILTEDRAGVNPLHKDGAGMSVIMENHEPKHWSYFQKLAQEEFVQKDFSLMDQDHLGTPPLIAKFKEGDQNSYHFARLKTEGVSMDQKYSRPNFVEGTNQKVLAGLRAADSTILSGFDHSHVKGSESMQFGVVMDNLKTPEPRAEGGNLDNRNSGLPPVGLSVVDFDIDTLQIIKNEDLEELRELGSGTFGTVYHGKWRGSDVAIKRLKKICFTGRSSEQERLTIEFWHEAEILSKLHHPNVVAFYGVVQDGPGGTLATVTEYMVDGSLRHVLLKKDRYLDRRKRLLIAMDAAFGMEYLHSKNIVHFDLKCDNLLVNLKDPQRPICKVGDFGLSKIKRNTLVSGGVRGTLPWMAPELLNGGSNKVSEKVDVFSFGIVLWEILTGEEPYANMHYGAIIGGIVNNTLRPAIPNFCDPEWKRLMEQCWAPNPAARPAFTEIAGRLRIMSTAASQNKGQGHKASK
ncbi:serine/threonine protein kinase, putative [Ricinus communis]|uniref:Serine/threonine protein kinase, putative n=2 Tax=Ricinus communis TaxID=3988 RepID=B9RHZ3_RICCO|nr:serine/threonine protein kinase, putative [Ricinus communis]